MDGDGGGGGDRNRRLHPAGIPDIRHRASVVASTDVWGSVAGAVAGDHAAVTSIMSGTVADPHSFEASPADTARSPMPRWSSSTAAATTTGSTVCSRTTRMCRPSMPTRYAPIPQEPANEHVFYDPATAKAVAAQIADRLSTIDAVATPTPTAPTPRHSPGRPTRS